MVVQEKTASTAALMKMFLLAALYLAALCQASSAWSAEAVHADRLMYQVTVDDGIEATKQNLISALEGKNYTIINVLNVQEGLKGRGIETHPIQLVEFCNLSKAYQVTRTANEFEIFAPCRMALFEEGGKTTIKVLRPRHIRDSLPQDKLSPAGTAALDIFEQDIREVLETVASGGF